LQQQQKNSLRSYFN